MTSCLWQDNDISVLKEEKNFVVKFRTLVLENPPLV